MPLFSKSYYDDLIVRLGALADDEKKYMNLQLKEIEQMLGCGETTLRTAMIRGLIPTPYEVRQTTVSDLHAKGYTCTEISEDTGIHYDTIRYMVRRFGLEINTEYPRSQGPWTPDEDRILIENYVNGNHTSLNELYAAVGRTRGAVEHRLRTLRHSGVIPHVMKRRKPRNWRRAATAQEITGQAS